MGNKTPNNPLFYNCGVLKPCKLVCREVPLGMLKQELLYYHYACYRRSDYHNTVTDIKMRYRRMKERGEIE